MPSATTAAATRPIVVVAAGIFPDPARVESFYGARADIRWMDLSTAAGIAGAGACADALIVATQRLGGPDLTSCGAQLRVISRSGVGLDAIDLQTAETLGITVVNQPAYGAVEVASHALAMALHLQRKLTLTDSYVRAGWSGLLGLAPMPALDELTLGVVGCGRIGGELARMASPLLARVLAYDPLAAQLPPSVERVDDLGKLLAQSDLLSIHSPLTPATRGLIGRRELSLLPPNAIVINVARGGILDEDALAELLISGHLGGAGVDVFAEEPLASNAAILSAPNTILSPHTAAYSERSSWRLASWAFDDALRWLEAGSVEHGSVVVRGGR